MSSKVESLQRASLSNPLRVSISSSSYQTVSTLLQSYLFIPHKYKDLYLVHIINEHAGQTTIIFTRTVNETQRVAYLLRALGFNSLPLHGQLSQTARLGALNKFKAGSRDILVATDVAARGLDIPSVDLVVNFDLPPDSKTYVHRVGRTARAGKAGRAISVVSQYDVEIYQRIEVSIAEFCKVVICANRSTESIGKEVARVRRSQRSSHGVCKQGLGGSTRCHQPNERPPCEGKGKGQRWTEGKRQQERRNGQRGRMKQISTLYASKLLSRLTHLNHAFHVLALCYCRAKERSQLPGSPPSIGSLGLRVKLASTLHQLTQHVLPRYQPLSNNVISKVFEVCTKCLVG